jgi:plastocyanin
MRVQLPFLAGAVFLAAACSDHTDPNPVDDGPPAAEVTVNVRDNLFVNAAARVLAGGTVTWVWQGDNLHNVTFNGGPASGNQTEGTFERTFDAPGVYQYLCTIHGQLMSGTVTVVEEEAGGAGEGTGYALD